MVRRFVEYQEVGFCNEYVGQCDAFLLATAELTHGLGEVFDLQLCENLFGAKNAFFFAMVLKAGV